MAWDQRFGRRVFFKAAYLRRNGSHAYILDPDAGAGTLSLSSSAKSRYWGPRRPVAGFPASPVTSACGYVRSHSTRDLNDYDQFFGTFRTRSSGPTRTGFGPTDVPHSMIVRAALGLPGRWVFSPIYEWRSGFPWSAVNESGGFRRDAQRDPPAAIGLDLDFTLARPLHFKEVPLHSRIRFTTRSTPATSVTSRPTSPHRLRLLLQSDSNDRLASSSRPAGPEGGTRQKAEGRRRRQRRRRRRKAEDEFSTDMTASTTARRADLRAAAPIACSRWEPPGWEPRWVGGRRRCSWLAQPRAWCSITPRSASPRPGACSSADRRGAGVRAQMLMLAVTCLVFFPVLASGSFFGQPVRGWIAARGPRGGGRRFHLRRRHAAGRRVRLRDALLGSAAAAPG